MELGRSGSRTTRTNFDTQASGKSSSTNTSASKKGLCKDLGEHVFDYGWKGAADEMQTTWEKIILYAGTKYGQDIASELETRTQVSITQPTYPQAALDRHARLMEVHKENIKRLRDARNEEVRALKVQVSQKEPGAILKLAELQNEMALAELEASEEPPIKLMGMEKTQLESDWKTYRARVSQLITNRGNMFSVIKGQCQQVLTDKMLHDKEWDEVNASSDPLRLYALIEKTILAQTEDQYPPAIVYEQEVALYGFQQNNLTNQQYYERFNTKVDVATAVGVTREHQVLLQYETEEVYGKEERFDSLTEGEQDKIRAAAVERYLTYVFLRQSNKLNDYMKTLLQDDFTKGQNTYPADRQAGLKYMDKFTKTKVSPVVISEGTAFATQGGGDDKHNKSNRTKDGYDKDYWKEKKCYKCGEEGHPASHCPKKDEDSQSQASMSSQASKKSVKKLAKDTKSLKKAFATLAKKVHSLKEADSDLSDSDSDSDDDVSGNMHFQIGFASSPSNGRNRQSPSQECGRQ